MHVQSRRFLVAGFCLLWITCFCSTGWAQSTNTANTLKLADGSSSPAATIEQVAWIAGDWEGEGLGGHFQESWNRPSGDSMIGMFKLVEDGKTVFSEHMTIRAEQNSLVLQIKHFDPRLHGWEEKDETVDFPLVRITADEVAFAGLTFRKSGSDGILIFVAVKHENGDVEEMEFTARRLQPTGQASVELDRTDMLDEIDQYAQKVMRDWNVPGMSVAIVQGGEILFAKGYGVRNINHPEPVDADTLFAIASNSKAFTAAALAILVDEGKVAWDDPVTDYIPTFQMPDAWTTREMTVRDLLCHRSGMDTFSGDLLWYDTNYTADQVVERIKHLKPVSSFRSRYGYQNLMYITAGKVIEQVSGQSWAEFVRERILDPLGMSHTTTSVTALKENFASPHNKSGGDTLRALPVGNVDNSWGACGLNSSVNELSRWMQMQLASGEFMGARVLPARQLHEMWQPWMVLQQPFESAGREPLKNFQAYGLGYFLADWYGHKLVHHSGGLDGMISQLAMVPDLNLGVVVLTNSESSASRYVRDRVLECFMGIAERPDRSAAGVARVAAADQSAAAARDKIDAERKSDTQPTIPLHELAGRFRSELYGDVIVAVEEGKLVLRMEPAPNFVADLEHWHYNTFQIHWRDSVKYDFPRGFVNFTIDAHARPTQLVIDQPNNDFWFYELELKRVE